MREVFYAVSDFRPLIVPQMCPRYYFLRVRVARRTLLAYAINVYAWVPLHKRLSLMPSTHSPHQLLIHYLHRSEICFTKTCPFQTDWPSSLINSQPYYTKNESNAWAKLNRNTINLSVHWSNSNLNAFNRISWRQISLTSVPRVLIECD